MLRNAFVNNMYVNLDNVLNNLTPDQKLRLDWFYKSSKEFFIDDFNHIVDLYPQTTGPKAWDLKRSAEKKDSNTE